MALLLAERDPVFFVEEFCWTYDPRENHPLIPFLLYDTQQDAIRWMKDLVDRGKNGVFEKSRDMGATWLTAAFAVYLWLFRRGAAIGFGSRKLELVDKLGDPKSIFDKIRTIINNLPPWLLQARAGGFDPKQHDNFCKIINPATGASITGEGGDEIGRGGRTTVYFVDEAAFIQRPLAVDRALSANSRCRIDVSTPNGSNNPFATKRLSKKVPVFTLHWKDDPRKTAWVIVKAEWEAFIDDEGELIIPDDMIVSYGLPPSPVEVPEGCRLIYPWYEEVLLTEDPVTVAQEYDIDYSASLEGVIVPAKWLRACVGLQIPESKVGTGGYDVAAGGKAEHVYIHRKGPVVKRIIRWRGDDPTTGAFKVVRYAEEDEVARLFYDVIGAGTGIGGAIRLIQRPLRFRWAGVNVGIAPTATIWPDKQTSQEKFRNLKAEMWWRMRSRVEKTYLFVVKGIYFPPDELLSLPPGPDTEALIQQLSNVKYFETDTGKIIVESKEKMMQDRGVPSPDLAEALILSFAPVKLSETRGTHSGGQSPQANPSKKQAVTGKIKAPFTIIHPSTGKNKGVSRGRPAKPKTDPG